MIIVQNSIISDDVADQRFACDLACCHGACCVEGDSGAPLLDEEVPVMQRLLPDVLPLLTPEGRDAVGRHGVAVRDAEGDLGTPLCPDGRCAFLTAQGLCAFQLLPQAAAPQAAAFPKPISCHLYPIRVEDYGEFTAVNYHRWDICRPAAGRGPLLYEALREPLVRRFGQAWYDELVAEIESRTPINH